MEGGVQKDGMFMTPICHTQKQYEGESKNILKSVFAFTSETVLTDYFSVRLDGV